MSTTDNYDSFSIKTHYTLNEAIGLIRRQKNQITTRSISWVNSRTGEPVIIGCTSN